MASDITGLYVPAEHVEAIKARVEAVAAQLNELLHEVSTIDLIDISVRKMAAKPTKAAKPRTSGAVARKAAPTVNEASINEARAKLEAATHAAKPPKANKPAKAPDAPAADGERPVVPRQRFGKLKEHLLVDFGPEVAAHMVTMCGDNKVTLNLRKQRDRFVGTYPNDEAAAKAYLAAVGLEADYVGAAETLGELSDVLHYDDGRVSVWGNEGDEEPLRKWRQKEKGIVAADPAVAPPEESHAAI